MHSAFQPGSNHWSLESLVSIGVACPPCNNKNRRGEWQTRCCHDVKFVGNIKQHTNKREASACLKRLGSRKQKFSPHQIPQRGKFSTSLPCADEDCVCLTAPCDSLLCSLLWALKVWGRKEGKCWVFVSWNDQSTVSSQGKQSVCAIPRLRSLDWCGHYCSNVMTSP